MKVNESSASCSLSLEPILQHLSALSTLIRHLLAVAVLLLCAGSAFAAQLTWDPNGDDGLTGGSGSWSTTNADWFDGVALPDVDWGQTSGTSATDGAIFGGGNGSYDVTNAVEIAVTNLTFLSSGYVFDVTGQPFYNSSGGSVIVASGVTVTFSNAFAAQNSGLYWEAGSNSVVNILGDVAGNQSVYSSTNGGIYVLANNVGNGVTWIDATVIQTNGTFSPGASFFVGRPNGSSLQPNNGAGTYVLATPTAVFTDNGGTTIVARGGGQGTFIISNGATANVGTGANDNMVLDNDSSGGEVAVVDVWGGTLNVGLVGSSSVVGEIEMMPAGATATESATFNETNGVVNAWGGIFIGVNGTESFAAGSFADINVSGGFLYLGGAGPNGGGINEGTAFPPAVNITFSGGTVGALGNWSSPLPITLGTLDGNVTFQTANSSGSPYNISLSGALTGAGGMNVTGGGTLTLSGVNDYSGSTSVSNGTLAVVTTPSGTTSGGPVTVDGATASPTLTVQSSPGQIWSAGALTFQNGTTTLGYSFGALTPSASVAPLQVNGNLEFSATPAVTVAGAAISVGTYPLITYTGSLSGTAPTTVSLPSYCSGYITSSGKTIELVVTSSTISPALYWAVANGAWNFTSSNWRGSSSKYTDGSVVIFDDTASGTSPITVTLNNVVNPASVTANNTAKAYIISGTGSIVGSDTLSVTGGGTLTLATTNSYSGGTLLSSGQLNINTGGDSSGLDSAIGGPAGALVISGGTAIDNTSGSNVTLVPSISEYWNGNFTYVGSGKSFNTGPGSVTMTNGNVDVAVNGNDLTVGGAISDTGLSFKITKTGTGVLTLPVPNDFGGGFELVSGQVNPGDPSALGQGTVLIDGGSIDNVSGAPITLAAAGYVLNSSFTFLGTTNLDLGSGEITMENNVPPVSVNVLSNTLENDGTIIVGNNVLTKTGNGTWLIAGTGDNAVQMVVAGGVLDLAQSGYAILSSGVGFTVESNAIAFDVNGSQIDSGNGDDPVILESGGVFDINGQIESFDSLSITNGIFRNSAINSFSTLTLNYPAGGNLVTLGGTNSQFDVASGATLTITGNVVGGGSLVMTGLGELELSGSNGYTGDTIIESGALGLTGASAISNSPDIYLASANSALDLTQSGSPLALISGQTLGGFGIVTGLVTTVSGATVAPGSASTVGTLTVTPANASPGASTLNGALLLSLNRTNAQTSSSVVFASGNTVTYGGTLSVTNIGPALHAGDVFQLFPSAVTTFASISLPTTDASGNTYTWNNNVGINGSITVTSATSPINPNPGRILFGLSGATLSLSWPTNSGWILQTNAVGLLDTNAWYPYPGSSTVTTVNINIGQSENSVFFRLVYP
jgi:autotransporter-associated beta strand protein